MRSFLNPWSIRAKYWVPFRTDVAPKAPVSIIGKLQGMFSAAGVPHTPAPRTCDAVLEVVAPTMPEGRYVLRICVPTVPGLFACAKAMNSGAANVADPPALDDDRSGSTEKKKKLLWWGIIGPPIEKSMLFEWNGAYGKAWKCWAANIPW